MDIKQIISSIEALSEDITSEEALQDIPEKEPEVAPTFNDGMSLADTLDTKAKIARCLEALKQAVEDFKDATAEKIDLLKDEMLLGGLAELDEVIKGIELALASGSNILGDSELNDAFKAELPQEEKEEETEDGEANTAEPEESEEDADAPVEDNAEQQDDDYDFDSEAGLNLLAND